MKILILADDESKSLWDYFERDKLDGIDLIISCGDLEAAYLSFLATFTKAPVLYVCGNHDSNYLTHPPDGCICIEDKIFTFQGVRIMGLGGSMRYKPGPFQFTQAEMYKRIRKMKPKLWLHRGVDIVVAHSPAYQIGDGPDIPHTGFQAFVALMDKYKPAFFLHGHWHGSYGGNYKRIQHYHDTTIINGYIQYTLEYDFSNQKKKSKTK